MSNGGSELAYRCRVFDQLRAHLRAGESLADSCGFLPRAVFHAPSRVQESAAKRASRAEKSEVWIKARDGVSECERRSLGNRPKSQYCDSRQGHSACNADEHYSQQLSRTFFRTAVNRRDCEQSTQGCENPGKRPRPAAEPWHTSAEERCKGEQRQQSRCSNFFCCAWAKPD